MYSLAVNQLVYLHINSRGQAKRFIPSLSPPSPLPLHRLKNSSSLPPSSYEFPNGYNQSFTVEKFKLCEGLFDSSTPNLKVQEPPVTGSDNCSGHGDWCSPIIQSTNATYVTCDVCCIGHCQYYMWLPWFHKPHPLCRVFMEVTCWLSQRLS